MMKQYILIMLFTLAGLAGMAQTNETLPGGAVQFSNQLWLNPADSTIWTGDVFEGKFVNLGSWHKVDSLLALKADASDLDDYYTQSQIDAFLALKADESALDDFYTKLEVDGLLGGYVPTSRTVNGKALTGNITLNANDVNALQAGDNVSDLVNDVPYLTSGDIPAPPVTSVNSKTGAVVVTKADVGLGNVDNTSDLNKPISTATQAALDGKEDKSNKVTSLSTPNNTTYPTTQAVKNAIDAIEPPDVTGTNGIQVSSGVVSPVYGTSAGTVAQGNDSRINNGQTAYGWGNHAGLYVNRLPITSFDWSTAPSLYARFLTGSANGPGSNVHGLYIPHSSANYGTSLVFRIGRGWIQSYENGVMGTWREIYTTENLTTFTRSNNGLVPAPGGSGSTRFMREDGTWAVPSGGGGGGTATDLSIQNRNSSTLDVGSSTGTAATIPAATSSLSGLLTATDKNKLDNAITSETDPTVASHVKDITTTDIGNWNAGYAYSLLNHFRSEYTRGRNVASANANTELPSGGYVSSYSSTTWLSNSAFSGYGGLIDYNMGGGLGGIQLNFDIGHGTSTGGRLAFRTYHASGQTSWKEIWHSGNLNPSDYLAVANFTWTNLAGKPTTFAPSAHTHNASDINAGTLAIGRIPTGTTGSTVALGNHTHDASAITSGTLNIARIPTGTSSSTVAIGNDSRINNGQTAYGWGNHASAGYAVIGTSGSQVRTNTQLDARYLQSGDLPTVNNGTLSLSTGTGLTGSASFTANQSGNSSFTVAAASGYAIPTTSQISTWNNAVPSSRTINGKTLSADVTLTAADVSAMPTSWTITAGNGLTGGGTGAANRTLNVGAGDGIDVAADIVNVDGTVARRTGTNAFTGNVSFSNPVEGAQATASNHFVTKAQMDAAVSNIIKIDTPKTMIVLNPMLPGTTATSTLSVSGATVGDVVSCTIGAGFQNGMVAQGRVTSSGTVTLYLTNATPNNLAGGNVDIYIALIK